MERIASRSDRGVSLVEVLFAIMILAIVSLAILQTALVGYRHTAANVLRDEAVRIVEQKITDYRALPYTASLTHSNLAAGTKPDETVKRKVRQYFATYTVKTTISDLTSDTKQITMIVEWRNRDQTYNHTITTILGRS